MSIVQNPIIGRAKGQAGGMVFTTLNGQNVMKAKPNSYRDANTVTQQTNRSLHTDLVRMAASIKSQARSLFEKQPSDMPAFSKLVQQLSAGVNRSGGSPVFDPDGITIGSGSVNVKDQAFTYTPGTGIVEANFEVPSSLSAEDLAVKTDLLVIDKVAKTVSINTTSNATFADGNAAFELPIGLNAANLSFCLVNRTKFSGGADLQKVVK